MVKVTCLLAKAGSGVGLSFGVRALTQMEIRCVKGMLRLKLISSEKNSVFKELMDVLRYNALNTVEIRNRIMNTLAVYTIRVRIRRLDSLAEHIDFCWNKCRKCSENV